MSFPEYSSAVGGRPSNANKYKIPISLQTPNKSNFDSFQTNTSGNYTNHNNNGFDFFSDAASFNKRNLPPVETTTPNWRTPPSMNNYSFNNNNSSSSNYYEPSSHANPNGAVFFSPSRQGSVSSYNNNNHTSIGKEARQLHLPFPQQHKALADQQSLFSSPTKSLFDGNHYSFPGGDSRVGSSAGAYTSDAYPARQGNLMPSSRNGNGNSNLNNNINFSSVNPSFYPSSVRSSVDSYGEGFDIFAVARGEDYYNNNNSVNRYFKNNSSKHKKTYQTRLPFDEEDFSDDDDDSVLGCSITQDEKRFASDKLRQNLIYTRQNIDGRPRRSEAQLTLPPPPPPIEEGGVRTDSKNNRSNSKSSEESKNKNGKEKKSDKLLDVQPVAVEVQVPKDGAKDKKNTTVKKPTDDENKKKETLPVSVESRTGYFSHLATTVDLLKRKRLAQEEAEKAAAVAETRLPSIVSEGGDMTGAEEFVQRYSIHSAQKMMAISSTSTHRQAQKYYYTDLTKEEEMVLEELLREAKDIKTRMQQKYDARTVQGSWAILLRGDNLLDFGLDVYNGLVQEKVFIPQPMAHMSVEERITSIVGILDKTICLYDNPQHFFEKLIDTGTRHRVLGIGEHSFCALRDSFMASFRKYLPLEVIKSSSADWNSFWKLAVNLMLNGGRSAEGLENGKKFEVARNREIVEMLHFIHSVHNKEPNLADHFVRVMIENGVTEDPSLERFRATFSSRRACERLFSSLLQIAENSDNKTENEAYMRELGGRHAAYMVNRQVLESFENPFLLACERFLKTEDKWHDTNKGHLKYFYSMIVDNISAGMDTGKNSGENKRAPTGSEPFCLLFTDIESSTNLWQRFPNIMREAVEQHHRIIRGIIHEYGGYEVKTAGDSFIIAARDVLVGLKIAVGIQLELMRHLPIVEGFEMLEEVQGGGDPEAWSNQTFRVRIGIEHCTQATATYDTIHRRYDYYGPSVNQCARIEAAAAGGQILMSRETFKALKAIPTFHDEPCPADLRDIAGNSPVDERGFDHFVAMCDVGKVKLKGIRKEVHVASVVPMCLAGRAFKIWSSNIDL